MPIQRTLKYKNMNTPKISIITPVYNAELFIEKCVTSLFEQTLDDLEYIFVDDCSTDDSMHVLGNIIAKHPRKNRCVKILKQSKNKGQAAARNLGIMQAKGEYVGFVDSDDWVSPSLYETLYKNAKRENALISCCGVERMLNEKHESYFNDNISEYRVYTTKEAIESLLDNVKITCSPCDKIFHQSIVKKNPMLEGIIFEDFEVMPRWIHQSERIVYCGLPLYYYRYNPQSTMTTITWKRFNEVEASKMRIRYFYDNYPDLLKKVEVRHWEICLNVLSCTVRAEKCSKDRSRLRLEILNNVNREIFCCLKTYSKLKYILLLAGLNVFDNITKLKYNG